MCADEAFQKSRGLCFITKFNTKSRFFWINWESSVSWGASIVADHCETQTEPLKQKRPQKSQRWKINFFSFSLSYLDGRRVRRMLQYQAKMIIILHALFSPPCPINRISWRTSLKLCGKLITLFSAIFLPRVTASNSNSIPYMNSDVPFCKIIKQKKEKGMKLKHDLTCKCVEQTDALWLKRFPHYISRHLGLFPLPGTANNMNKKTKLDQKLKEKNVSHASTGLILITQLCKTKKRNLQLPERTSLGIHPFNHLHHQGLPPSCSLHKPVPKNKLTKDCFNQTIIIRINKTIIM